MQQETVQSRPSNGIVKGPNEQQAAHNGHPFKKRTPDSRDSSADNESSNQPSEGGQQIKFEEWGFNIDRLFEVAYRFYKRNESKAFHPSFDVRNQMNALILQARYGNFDGGKVPDIGVLDLVGKRRRHEWSLLKGISKAEAMSKFICNLDEMCPFFKAHAEAVKLSSGLGQNPQGLGLGNNSESGQIGIGPGSESPETSEKLQAIYSSLCRQTHPQFKSYAEKQHPNNQLEQKRMISALQEQYYQQYISQMHPELKLTAESAGSTSSGRGSNQSSNIPSSMPSPSASLSSSNVTSNLNNMTSSSPQSTSLENYANHTVAMSQLTNTLETVKLNDLSSHQLSGANMMDSDHYRQDKNNMEADVSSEELISAEPPNDPAPPPSTSPTQKKDNSSGHSIADQGNHHQNRRLPAQRQLSEISDQFAQVQSPPELPTIQEQQIYVEPVRLYQNNDFVPIGPFESFPAPKPIENTLNRVTPIDLIDPNLPRAPASSHLSHIGQHSLNGTASSLQAQSVTSSQPSHTSHTPSDQITPEMNSLLRHNSSNNDLSNQVVVSATQEEITTLTPPQIPVTPPPPELWANESSSGNCSPLQQSISYEPLEPATFWTKRGVAEFKESLANDKHGGVYEVKLATLVVIQVPTYPEGKFIYWEFATDDYDIGFGLDFVFEANLAQPLSLRIYEESDEDEEYDDEDVVPVANYADNEARQNNQTSTDPELGGIGGDRSVSNRMSQKQAGVDERRAKKIRRMASTVSIIPTYRRDSHEEVFVGRHKYPGQGYYLLKFDNTYSVLRSKSLYFRVCYFI